MIYSHLPKNTRHFAIFSLIALLLLISACAPVISEELRDQAATDATFIKVWRNPEVYEGKIVLWAGVILKREDTTEGTFLEVLQTPADFRGEPGDIYLSKGRFLALNEGDHLNARIYTKGRGVTVAGEIKDTGDPLLPSDPSSPAYYPLILIKEIHSWPGKNRDSLYNRKYFWSPWGLP
jgi:outer membrane lipoprotein